MIQLFRKSIAKSLLFTVFYGIISGVIIFGIAIYFNIIPFNILENSIQIVGASLLVGITTRYIKKQQDKSKKG